MMLRISEARFQGRLARPGVVLLAVLIVTIILILVGYAFLNLMTAEHDAVYAAGHLTQLRLVAASGVDYAAFVLSNPQNAGLNDADGSVDVSPTAIYDNAQIFNGIPVQLPNPKLRGYFTILSARDDDPNNPNGQGFRFGVEDESGKINVNALLQLNPTGDPTGQTALTILQNLPNMPQDTASAIFTWVTPVNTTGSTTTGSGTTSSNSASSNSAALSTASSDSDYYSSLGYQLKSAPLESLEELLMVREMTPRLLLGNDLNRNTILEPEEDDQGGTRDPGLARYLTIYSRELNLDSQGQPRIYVNDSNLQGLEQRLQTVPGIDNDLATFIVAYRIYGPASGAAPPGRGGGSAGSLRLTSQDYQRGANGGTRITSLFQLIGASVNVPGQGRIPSPIGQDAQSQSNYLPVVLDELTTSSKLERPARININTAPLAVLQALQQAFPALDDNSLQQILTNRPSSTTDPSQAAAYRTTAWLITQAGLKPSLVQSLDPYITARSQVFRVQVVGYQDVNGPAVRQEAVIDTNQGHPRILYWRDITELGRGFDLRMFAGMQ